MASSGSIRFETRFLRARGKYSLEQLDDRQKAILEKKLQQYGQLTEAEFRFSGGAKLHAFAPRGRKAPSAYQWKQVRLELSVEIAELGPLMRFRASRKMRVLGYLADNIFYVIWVDPNHEM